MVDITTLEVNTAGVAAFFNWVENTCTSIAPLPHPSTSKWMHVCMTTGLNRFMYKLQIHDIYVKCSWAGEEPVWH